MIGREINQRLFGAFNNMFAVSDVMTNNVFFARCRRDTAFTDDFHPFTQMGRQFQRLAKRRFALIAAINISMVHGSNAEIQMLLNKAN